MKTTKYFRHFEHNENTIHKLSEVQFFSFQKLTIVFQLLIGAGFLYFGAMVIHDTVSQVLSLLFGSLLIVGLKELPKYQAYKIINNSSGKLPVSDFSFFEDCFEVTSGGYVTKVEYSRLLRLVYDDKYVYLFINKNGAYMMSRLNDDEEEFESYISNHTSKEWVKVQSIFLVSFKSLIKEHKNTNR